VLRGIFMSLHHLTRGATLRIPAFRRRRCDRRWLEPVKQGRQNRSMLQ
jgi:hypothetical protein